MCNAMGALQIAGLAFQTVGAMNQAKAQRQAYEYQAQVSRNNALIQQEQAKRAIEQGQQEEQNQRLKVASLFGDQRAQLAANGVDLGEGIATDLLTTTKFMGERDALTIRDNSARKAWAYRVQGQNYLDDASFKDAAAGGINPLMSGATTLLGGAGSVADSWYKARKSGLSTNEWLWGK